MTETTYIKSELSRLAVHLAERREHILRSWLRAVELDQELSTPSGISRSQFNDHIPQVLDAFGHRLQAEDASDKAQAHSEQKRSAAEHGLHKPRVIVERRLHRTCRVTLFPSFWSQRLTLFVVSVRKVVFESILPNHTGADHTERLIDSFLHQGVKWLSGNRLHYQLRQSDSFA